MATANTSGHSSGRCPVPHSRPTFSPLLNTSFVWPLSGSSREQPATSDWPLLCINRSNLMKLIEMLGRMLWMWVCETVWVCVWMTVQVCVWMRVWTRMSMWLCVQCVACLQLSQPSTCIDCNHLSPCGMHPAACRPQLSINFTHTSCRL